MIKDLVAFANIQCSSSQVDNDIHDLDIASATPLMLAGRAVPPPMGVVSSGGVTSSLGYSCTPG